LRVVKRYAIDNVITEKAGMLLRRINIDAWSWSASVNKHSLFNGNRF
jgi:hypothetical protein